MLGFAAKFELINRERAFIVRQGFPHEAIALYLSRTHQSVPYLFL